jgi:predicted class III extradiol MEMO1 family dioxygenase
VDINRLKAIEELRATGKFTDMSIETDEDEHSIEMHLPYVRKIFEGYVAENERTTSLISYSPDWTSSLSRS